MCAKALKKLLILDLDETLVYATLERLEREPNFMVGPYFVYKRPHVDSFIEFCLSNFRVAVWSSSSADYCVGLVRQLFADPSQLEFVWASDRCTHAFDMESGERYWRKNIRKVKRLGIPLESVIAIDDTLQKWEKSYGNIVLVSEYLGDPSDDELALLPRYLEQLLPAPNIRIIDKLGWRRKLSRDADGPA